MTTSDSQKSPPSQNVRHIAIIMDGNGRWAKERGLSRGEGHLRGAEVAQKITEKAAQLGIGYLTLYAFSSENWSRPPEEVEALLDLLRHYLTHSLDHLHRNQVCLRVIGAREKLPQDVQKLIEEAEAATVDYKGLTLSMAVSYGGREEIVSACRLLALKVAEGRLHPNDIDQDHIESALYTRGLPDPDLFIRTGGELRTSNFLNWQMSYTEFVFYQKYWPDFTEEDLVDALKEYSCRERRFGTV